MNPEIERLKEATDNLINQQFYNGGDDTLIGRTPEVSVKIRNSGQIIQKFKTLFNSNLELFLKGKYLDFLLPFEKIKDIDERVIKEINVELQEKLQYLSDTDFDIVVLYTIVLSALITRIRDHHFNRSLDEIRNRVRKIKSNIKDSEIQKELDELFMRNNGNISLLYNLSYLDALAESFNYSKVAQICKIQKGKFINRTVKLILKGQN